VGLAGGKPGTRCQLFELKRARRLGKDFRNPQADFDRLNAAL
jgi:hypothetical protein